MRRQVWGLYTSIGAGILSIAALIRANLWLSAGWAVPAHPYKVAMEVAGLAANAEVTLYPWKDSQEHIDAVVEQARRFLKAHEPIKC